MTGITVKDDGHSVKWVSTVPNVSLDIFDIKDVNEQVIAVMKWAALSRINNNKIYQPCIEAKVPLKVMYDGEAINSFGSEKIINPLPSDMLHYDADNTYFFCNIPPFNLPDYRYSLTKNNSSLRFNNISLFHLGSNLGVAMDFRASYQNDKCVIVLASRLQFETPEIS